MKRKGPSGPFFIPSAMMHHSDVSRAFDPDCRRCPRLVEYRRSIKRTYPEYFSAPVPAFGDSNPRLLIVGLAPGLHGANASGRPFTGDSAGSVLYAMLYEFGFSTGSDSINTNDGLELNGCRITNAVQCLPPQNRPQGPEIARCNPFLRKEIERLKDEWIVLALGHLAHNAVLNALDLRRKDFEFAHHRVHNLKSRGTLVDSYHCSRYNLQTRRLTIEGFRDVFQTIRDLIG